MPRSSKHKSHNQSKHSTKEYSDSGEDVKVIKERNNKEETSVRVSKDLGNSTSGEKRKYGKDGNGDASEEYAAASKRRREKVADGSSGGGGGDRWNGGGDKKGEKEKELKGESSKLDLEKGSKGTSESKSKSSSNRRHESGGERKEENVGTTTMEKDESKSGSRSDSKRKSDKESSGRKEGHQYKESKEGKEKERGSEKERKGQDSKREPDVSAGEEFGKKQGLKLADLSEEQQCKRERHIQDDMQNLVLGKEPEKKVRRRRDRSIDDDKNPDDVRGSDDKRLSSKGDHTKDGRYKDERHKEVIHGDKYNGDGNKDNRLKDDKYHEDAERENRQKDAKYREERERESRHRDDKYRKDGDHDYRHRDDKYREDGEREHRRRDDKYREAGDKDTRRREEKYREDNERENRHLDDKYREDADRDNTRSGDRYRDSERDDRHRDDKYREDGDRDHKLKRAKDREDVDRDSRHRDDKHVDDVDSEKRLRYMKSTDDRGSRDYDNNKPVTKRSKGETDATNAYHRKSSFREGSPGCGDKVTRHKEDQGRRRANDNEEHVDMRSRSNKEQQSDAEKRSMGSAKGELVVDRGRSNSRNADVELTPSHSRRRSSPTSSAHAARDHYRASSRQEEAKYRDYVLEERGRRNVVSARENASAAGVTDKNYLSWSADKPLPNDGSHFVEFSAERRLKSDARASPLQMVDKSPLSMGADRRHLNRSDVRRSIDVEKLGQRSGGSKDGKDYAGKEGRGNREFPVETHAGEEDSDSLSISTSFTRTGQFYGNSKSLLPPPPPYRTGVDSPLAFGLSEDDNRGKSFNRLRRVGDPNMGRAHGNSLKGAPNWPFPVANGFMAFEHGQPSVSFPHAMQQFPAPPMFAVRPSMELNHGGIPYHISNADRFSGQGRPLGWPNPVDDSRHPPFHGWDENNAFFGDASHIYGMSDWNNNRTQMSNQGWDTGRDMWKGQNSGASRELASTSQRRDHSALGPSDDVWANQSGQQTQNEQNQLDHQEESIEISQFSDALERNTLEVLKSISEEGPDVAKMAIKDDTRLCIVYLSRLDISTNLIKPELYNQWASLMERDKDNFSEDSDSKIFCMQKVAEANIGTPTKTSNTTLFTSINDSLFQKAMSLYKKQRDETGAINGDEMSFAKVEDVGCTPTSDQVGADSSHGQLGELVQAFDQQEAEMESLEVPIGFQNGDVVPATAHQKLDELVIADTLKKSEEPISDLNEEIDVDPISDHQSLEPGAEEKSVSLDDLERSDARSPSKPRDVNRSLDSGGNGSSINKMDQHLFDTKCGPLPISDASSDAFEAVIPESIECGLVNLNRIHHSPESTH